MLDNSYDTYKRWFDEKNMPDYLKRELATIATDSEEIKERFHSHLTFGTGGMRGILGAGINRMNIFTIRRVAEGLSRYLATHCENASKRSVVIAYDTRHLSKEFALEAARVIGTHGFRVYLFNENRPTPELSFAVRYLEASAGIVITASHNPSNYNGIKVYGDDGGQLASKEAQEVLSYIEDIQDIFGIALETAENLMEEGLLIPVLEEIDTAYQHKVLTLRRNESHSKSTMKELPIVYTPLHGTGLVPVTTALKAFGFSNVTVVAEQALPNPDFSTVHYPNPEEPDTFKLAMELGVKTKAELLLATDPDADRLGVAARKGDRTFEIIGGNELGALLLHYLLLTKEQAGTLPTNGVILKTIVTSELGRRIAAKFNVQTIDTLTGFKFISEKIKEYEATGEYTFLFGYEESYGYLLGDFVRDKDAVQAAVVTAEMAAYHLENGKTLFDVLDDLYKEFGYHAEATHALTFEGIAGQEKIERIMDIFRLNPPTEFGGVRVVAVEDYEQHQRIYSDGRIELLNLHQSNVLKFLLEDDSWICVRPSGTEPKCKFYLGVKKETSEEAARMLEIMWAGIMDYLNTKGVN
ncbi:phospho-sugar mutase [Sporosarcina oncorhynchi]|uniref:Phosphoglucomutase n=1 Tax=Sporosarcina oncorhynchi TaxID=3056444 RepID=A0ABZ0L1S8_9BACL|nr:phospho-sugar mutase [Sporosarcina sp. T2O-4]WOV86461.1 phospho-sugar mutase [Sporosarcina sp. T2O-4]